MSADDLIQKDLFGENKEFKSSEIIDLKSENLTIESLEEDSKKRPRQRKTEINLIKKFKEGFIKSDKSELVQENSHSFKTVIKAKLPPVLNHYVTLKEENIDRILLYRLGDFFECFFEDAILLSEVLQITLTTKDGGKQIGKIPMAGIPHNALERYCAELIKNNYSVVICDQLEKSSNKVNSNIKRGITRIITPGTVIEEGMLVAKKNNWITAIYVEENKNKVETKWGISKADVSTGELITMQGNSIAKLCDEIVKFDSAEIIIGSKEEEELIISSNKNIKFTVTKRTHFSLNEASANIQNYFGILSLEGIGLKNLDYLTKSLGGLLTYIKTINPEEYQNDSSVKIALDYPQVKYPNENLILDYQTKKNLEITTTQRENNYVGTLLWSIDRTYTCMGARCLRRWLDFPLLDLKEICKRQNIISNFLDKKQIRIDTQNLLRAMGDLERLSSRACAGQASARDLIAIADGLKKLPKLRAIIKSFKYELPDWTDQLLIFEEELLELADQISFTLVDNPPLNITDGGIIHDGVDNVLDGLRNIIDDFDLWLKNEEVKERKNTNISNLKIQYHRNLGYYIAINKSKINLAPQHWIKRQTLTNEERFVTTAIKSKESKIFNVKHRAELREYDLFCRIRSLVAKKTKEIRTIARSIACLDALLSLAIASLENGFIKPQIIGLDDTRVNEETEIIRGRNPIVEQLLDNKKFVPNDILFNNQQKIIILTGPNASGKSCFIRQIGLIQILAQIGGFVPAEKAQIKIVDRIFTRVGAVDDQSKGQSTFMVEMSETASILNQATKQSLVLLDEIGRGTSTFDGLSIAWSVSEYLSRKIICKTIFATHYHELNYLKNSHKNVSNFQVKVQKMKDRLEFCHKIEKGGSSKSYGIEAARLAGIPKEVINQAEFILSKLEANNNFNIEINLENIDNKAA